MDRQLASKHLENHIDFEDLQQKVAGLPRKQKQLGDVLLERPEVFAFGTLEALEKLLGVSRITIIRFAKSLGFEGYSPLQEAVREAYLAHIGFRAPNDASEPTKDSFALPKKTTLQHKANVDVALANLQMAPVPEICDALLSARRILVCGSGSAEVTGLLFVRLLRDVGLHGELVNHSAVDGIIAVNDLNHQDVVVGISLWLTFSDLLRIFRLAKRFDATTVAIIGSQVSPIRQLADHCIFAPAQGLVPTFSLVAVVAVIEVLIAELASRRPETVNRIQQRLHDLYVEEGIIASPGTR